MNHARTTHHLNNVSIGLWRGGVGQPVVFLHGASGVAGWSPFFAALADKFELIVPEHPWFGNSDCPHEVKSVEDLALFYLDLLDNLGLHDVHLVGTSLGGWLAAELAVRDCSKLSSLTLVAPVGLVAEDAPVTRMFSWDREETFRRLFHDPAFSEKMLETPPSSDLAQGEAKNRLAAARYAMSREFRNPQLANWLHRIEVPTTLVWGQDDRVVPAAGITSWEKGIPHAHSHVIPACGHLPHVEKASDLATIIANAIATRSS